eukprot:4111792-Lingulodinium_polyedra.AAC.1
MRLGHYKTAADTPWWGGPSQHQVPGQETGEPQGATKVEDVEVVAKAEAQKASGKPEEKGPVNQEPMDAKEVRKKFPNTLLCACQILSRDGLQSLVRLI